MPKQSAETVVMMNYSIQQPTGGPPEETAVSTIGVTFEMTSWNTHSLKHEDFLNELREFLRIRNSRTS